MAYSFAKKLNSPVFKLVINFRVCLFSGRLDYRENMILIVKLVVLSELISPCWLVGCFGLNGPLRQYFSLYRAVSQRNGERKEK